MNKVDIRVTVDEREARLREAEDAIVGRMVRRLTSLIGEPWGVRSQATWDAIVGQARGEAVRWGVDSQSGRGYVDLVARMLTPGGIEHA